MRFFSYYKFNFGPIKEWKHKLRFQEEIQRKIYGFKVKKKWKWKLRNGWARQEYSFKHRRKGKILGKLPFNK